MRRSATPHLPLALALLAAACTRPLPPVRELGAPGPASAESDPAAALDSVDFFAAATLARVADSLGASTGKELGARTTLRYLQGRRTATGGAEVHDHWSDVVFVQAGRAQLLSGGQLAGRRAAGAGEWRGDSILAGRTRPVGPGDFFVIPAGLPHQYLLAAGDSLRYLTIKAEGTQRR